MTARRKAPAQWTQLPLPTVPRAPGAAPPAPATAIAPPPTGHRERDQALPAADELARSTPRHDRGHVVAVAVTLVSVHGDVWRATTRPLYGHAPAWRRTLADLAAQGRTRAYNAANPRRCTWDSADGDPPP